MHVAFIFPDGADEKLFAKEVIGYVKKSGAAAVFAPRAKKERIKFELRALGAYEMCENDEKKVLFSAMSKNGILDLPQIKRALKVYPICAVLCETKNALKLISKCENEPFIAVSDYENIKGFPRCEIKALKQCYKENNNKIKKGSVLMDVNSSTVEEIVKKVLSQMSSDEGAASFKTKDIPKKCRGAVLTKLEHFDLIEYPVPEIGDDDILVKVEGCGVCGTDAHEFKRDPFGLIPVMLGHEGTGEIVKMGKNVKKDSAGKDLKLGDKVVTCMIFKDNPDITMFDLNKQNVGGADVYGLLPDDDVHLNGWFADYLVVRKGSTIFNVSDLDLDSRILIEPCAVLVHAVERAKTTNILRFNSRVVVQGCGPIGLICIAVLRTMGIENITAVDGNEMRLEFAKKMGATKTVNFKDYKGIEALAGAVGESFDGHLADFAFQCTGSPAAHSNIYKFIRNGGGLCELGFFINGGDATINPHFDICSKEITTVGSWVYTLRDYATTFDFLKRAKAIGLPMSELITHKFPLEKINEALETNLAMKGLKIAIVNE